MRRLRHFVAFFVIPLCAATLGAPSFADDKADVRAFVESLTDEAVALAKDSQADDAVRTEKLGALLKAKADYRWIAGFAAGAGLKEAGEEQRNRYFDLYPRYLVKNYLPKFKNYAGGAKPIIYSVDGQNGKFVVKTRLKGQNGAPLAVDYRIRKTDEGFKIYDVIAEGVSLIVTQRSEFSAFIQRAGMDGFLDKLQRYVEGNGA
ncbi:MAG: ABC transporter substrate-binding protein [Rickettsiales bacterium]